ncbi:MAG: polysaccharide pyruvyl transferase family protein [Gammaproteobacteria bacterium]|nr:polysaccharide pyruvyl transferase family protein [Gammaproteobacteria bacterium]
MNKFPLVMNSNATQGNSTVRPGTFSNAAHLELHLGGDLATRTLTEAQTGRSDAGTPSSTLLPVNADLDALLDSIDLTQTRWLEVLLQGCDVRPAATSGLTRLVERLPALQELTLTYTGMPDASTTSIAIGLHESCRRRGQAFAVDLILNTDADALEAPGPRPDTSRTLPVVLNVSRTVRSAGVPVRWLLPVVPALVYRLEPLFSLARDEDVDPVLAPHWIARSTRGQLNVSLDAEDRLFVHDFITYRLLDEEAHLLSPTRRDWYRALDDALMSHGSIEATQVHSVVVLAAAETEKGFGWTSRFVERPTFEGAADGLRAPRPALTASVRAATLFKQALDVCSVLFDGIRAVVQWTRTCLANVTRLRFDVEHPPRFNTVLLIGAYGGDHIGDTAILGGVLSRLSSRYGTTEAILMSQRPAHTRHLVPMLETPVQIQVEAYEHAKIRERLPTVDAVVFAGGPLIDQPKQLVRHLYTVSLARRHGQPFIMEGIGPGPFPRWSSEWTARRIVRLADRVAVRTSADSETGIMRGIRHDVGRDPAFDYLATRGAELTRLRAQDRQWIDRLYENTEGRLRVGINLRPIRHLFTVGVPASQRADYTRAVEARFEENLADGMRRFHRQSSPPPCFVFFPMNAIQFGMSDLRSAYRVYRHLREDVDYRVWQADASLDGVVALLRRLDIVITMRFHATIFALAQQRNVIGIDYRIGQRDKVGALLDDFGRSANCRRIDEFTSEWLLERLGAFAAGRHAMLSGHGATLVQTTS